ncbi:hypothetical protein SAMN04489735_10715 [Aneurinibacillus thermoaerophilus]|uniref:Uncharacterized protein n=1 Tax=Aneurinibacillus thermoaerophilus TaxID=143495 RepID=A0A1G8FK78_ANETH|nr:hypothetical protein [Aneurinibacillus thermoaerophilus]SDH82562.1 hypothetical protein SAMN04489735_10715 [Aneurinibacillus thermoaerophilus]
MANGLYNKQNLGLYLRFFRENSFVPGCEKQIVLAKILGISQKRVSEIENGFVKDIRLELALNWCTATGWHEGREVVMCMYGVDPLALPPITPEFNQRYGDALLNLRKQLKDALAAVDDLMEIWNSRRPNRIPQTKDMLSEKKQIIDVKSAINTTLYAAEREFSFEIPEVVRVWTQNTLSDGMIMPLPEELQKRMGVTA